MTATATLRCSSCAASAGLLWAQFLTAVWLYYALELPSVRIFGLEHLLRVPVRLYVGWLTVANVVTTAYVLERLEWDGWGLGDPTWAVIMLVMASAVGLFARLAWRDAVYGGMFVWALVGVALKEGQTLVVVVAASLLAFTFLLTLSPFTPRAARFSRRTVAQR